MRVGKRLEKILSLLDDKCRVVADIGTDHGILAFKILKENKAVKVIATDISAPSLDKAKELKKRYSIGDEFITLVGDGLKPLVDEKIIDIAIVAGMGGNEIVKILRERPQNLTVKQYIFQTMQDVEILREYLLTFGYTVLVDETIKDRDKFYSTIVCEPDNKVQEFSIDNITVGKTDREKCGADFMEWLDMEIDKQESRERYLGEEKKKRLNALKKIKLENEEKNSI